VESGSSAEWVPQSKPVRFTEIGCPAIGRGTNQPNVFFDPKSSESFVPCFNRGWRDDAIQRAYLEAIYLACRGTGKLLVNELALDKLQVLRDRLKTPLIVRSAYRSPEHNRAVGGAKRSKHMDGATFDIAMANRDPVAFEAAARAVGFLGFGFYPRSGFIHVDLGPARQWGERFPVREITFASETPAAREALAENRTMKGGGAAGVAMLGAAGVEVAQNVLAETQSAVLPLVPYLDTRRWVFIAVALAGLAVTIYAGIDDWQSGRR
jgi:hypothetical protein